jgi:hypothetical protein
MKRHLLFSAVVAVLLAAFLGACGGDDDNNDNGQQPVITTPGPTGPTVAGTTGTTGQSKSKKSGSSKKKKNRSSGGSNGSSGSSQQQNATEQPSKKADETGAAFKESNSKDVQDKVSYEAAKKVCKERKLKDLRAFYKPKGNSAEDVAKAVSRYYRPKHRADAAYQGCLAGYKQR